MFTVPVVVFLLRPRDPRLDWLVMSARHCCEWTRFMSRTDLGIALSGVWDELSQLLTLWPHCKGNAGVGFSIALVLLHIYRVSLYLEKSSRDNWAHTSACLGHLLLPASDLPRILSVLWCWQYYQGYTTTNRKMTDLQQILYSIVPGTWNGAACGPVGTPLRSLRCMEHPEIPLWPLCRVE